MAPKSLRLFWIAGVLAWLLATPATGAAQTVDPALKDAIEQLLALDDVAMAATQISRPFIDQMAAGLKRAQPTVTDAQLAVMREVVTGEFAKALAPSGPIRSAFVTIYAGHFTLDDITRIHDFYQSDTGKKFRAFGPVFQPQAARVVQEWIVANARQLSAAVQTRFKTEGFPALP